MTSKTILAVSALIPMLAMGALKKETLTYKIAGKDFEGYLAYDDSNPNPRPGILVVHEWKGINPYLKSRVDELARLGYIAFAPDIYGKGVRPATAEDAAATALVYKKDRGLMRARAAAGLAEIRKNKLVDKNKIAAIGYCFGGTVALELARSGADILGAVSFHGGLDTPDPKDSKNITAKILIFHGANDPFVTEKNVQEFETEMRNSKIDWQLVKYSGAVHSFTNPGAGKDGIEGSAYNKNADIRSWKAMQSFFKEIFTN